MGGVDVGTRGAGPRRVRLTAGLVGLAAVIGLASACMAPAAVTNAARAWGASEEGGSHISIRQDDDDAPPPGCAAPADALSYATEDTAESFTLTVTVAARLCAPIAAAAAVYAMPGNGVAWPQDLVERQDFVLDDAGVTEIEFTKTCLPAQFDVVTGATPARISPVGERHGPLLFPMDTRTARQHWGGDCGGTTTTTAPPPTVAPTSTVPGSSTTVPGGPTSTVPGGPTSTVPSGPTTTNPPSLSADTPTEVLGATTVPSGPAASPAAATPVSVSSGGTPPTVAGLALTGASVVVMVVSGLVLLLAGLAAQLLPRLARRRQA